MKIIFTLLIALFTLSVNTWAATVQQKIGYFTYELNQDTKEATLIKKPGTSDGDSYHFTKAVVIPGTVTYNDETYSVKKVGYEAFVGCNMPSVTIEEGVEAIDNFAFSYCGLLTSMKLPSTLNSLGAQLFWSSGNLKSVTIYASNPPAFDGYEPFQGVTLQHLYVPYSSLKAYTKDANWSMFADVISAAKGTAPASITWSKKSLSSIYIFHSGDTTINYVKVTGNATDKEDYCGFYNLNGYPEINLKYDASLTFSTILGKMTRIVISCEDLYKVNIVAGTGWTANYTTKQLIWHGDAQSSIVLASDGSENGITLLDISSIEFTFEGAPAHDPITWDQTDVNSVSLLAMSEDYSQDATIQDITVSAYSPTNADYASFSYITSDSYSYISIERNGFLTFSHPTDILKSIVISCDMLAIHTKDLEHLDTGTGWKWDSKNYQLKWSGSASEVKLACDGSATGIYMGDITSVVFAFEEAAPAPTSLTWTKSDLTTISLYMSDGYAERSTQTLNDITATINASATGDYCYFDTDEFSNTDISIKGNGKLTFTAPASWGNFTRIDIDCGHFSNTRVEHLASNSGWTWNSTIYRLTWEGNASSVVLNGDGSADGIYLFDIQSIEFEVSNSTPAPVADETITWEERQLNNVVLYCNSSYPTDETNVIRNVITSLSKNSSIEYSRFSDGSINISSGDTISFRSITGDFSKIVINCQPYGGIVYTNLSSDWSFDDTNKTFTWKGKASDVVTLAGILEFYISSIEFTYTPIATPRLGERFWDQGFEYEMTGAHTVKMVKQYYFGTIPAVVDYQGETYYVTEIADKAFANIVSTGNIYGGENIAVIGKNAFEGCTQMSLISLQSTVLDSIGDEAFKNCKLLSYFECRTQMPPVLGNNAFSGDNHLNHIHVYSAWRYQEAEGWSAHASKIGAIYSAPTIGEEFFDHNQMTTGWYAVSSASPKEAKVLPYPADVNAVYPIEYKDTLIISEVVDYMMYGYKVTGIGANAFKDSTRFKVVLIPINVKTIEADAFKNCTGVKNVFFLWDDPTTVTWADAKKGADFKTAADGGTKIIVPKGKLAAYKTWAPAWANCMIEGEIVPVTATQDPQYHARYYCSFFDAKRDYMLPPGVWAHVLYEENGVCVLHPIAFDGEILPKGTPVILESDNPSFRLIALTNDVNSSRLRRAHAAYYLELNELLGTDEELNVSTLGADADKVYVLGTHGTEITGMGMYRFKGTTLPAHSAYLIYSSSGSEPASEGLLFKHESDIPTGIEQSTNDQIMTNKIFRDGQILILRGDKIYTIQGQEIK